MGGLKRPSAADKVFIGNHLRKITSRAPSAGVEENVLSYIVPRITPQRAPLQEWEKMFSAILFLGLPPRGRHCRSGRKCSQLYCS